MGQPGQLPRPAPIGVAGADQPAGGIDEHRGADVRGHVDEVPGRVLGSQGLDAHPGPRYGVPGDGAREPPGMAVRIARVPLSRISWILTVAVCLIAAVLVLVNGYVGYFGVLLAVGGAAAVNLR